MSKNQQIRELLKGIVEAKATDAIVYIDNPHGANRSTWPGYLRLDSGLVHGYVIDWESGSQGLAKTPGTAEELWTFTILGFYENTGSEAVNTFKDFCEQIIFECNPEGRRDLPEGGHIKFGAFNWRFEKGEPGELLQIWDARLQIKFREGC